MKKFPTPKTMRLFLTTLVFSIIIVLVLLRAVSNFLTFQGYVEIVLTLIAGYFVLQALFSNIEVIPVLEKSQSYLKDLIDATGILRIIKSSGDYYQLLKVTIDNAKDSVNLLYLTPDIPSNIGKQSKEYWNWFQDYMLKRNNGVTVRRIACLNSTDKLRWLKESTFKLSQVESYGLRAYDPDKSFPLFGMEIIDREKVFLFGPHGKTPRWIYIENRDVAEGILQHFDTLWEKLKDNIVKDVNEIVDENKIQSRLEKIKIL